jgi:hypothetical protein
LHLFDYMYGEDFQCDSVILDLVEKNTNLPEGWAGWPRSRAWRWGRACCRSTLGWMHEAPTGAGPNAAATRRMMLDRDGYLFLRGLVPSDLVDAGCASITAEVARQGWLVEGTDPAELIVKKTPPGSGMLRTEESDVLMNDPAVRRVLHGVELHELFAELFGEPAVSLDYKWFRAVIPEQYSGFHMDNVCASLPTSPSELSADNPSCCRALSVRVRARAYMHSNTIDVCVRRYGGRIAKSAHCVAPVA